MFPHPNKKSAPLALRANVEHNGVLHEHVVIFSAVPKTVPHVALEEQVSVDNLGYADDGIVHVSLQYGFFDSPNIPYALARHHDELTAVLGAEVSDISYFLSRATLRRRRGGPMRAWRKALFVAMARNAANPAAFFGLPADRTVVMGTQIDL